MANKSLQWCNFHVRSGYACVVSAHSLTIILPWEVFQVCFRPRFTTCFCTYFVQILIVRRRVKILSSWLSIWESKSVSISSIFFYGFKNCGNRSSRLLLECSSHTNTLQDFGIWLVAIKPQYSSSSISSSFPEIDYAAAETCFLLSSTK